MRITQLLKRFIHLNTRLDFPTETYRFTDIDAQHIYSMVREGKLHHSSGSEIKLLEKEFAAYHNSTFALATTTGTAAIGLALKAIGLRPGDEVILPSYTNIAVAQVIVENGGIPVFADIDGTYTIAANSISACITHKTKAIIPVHMFGNIPDMDAIMTLARKHDLYVIEDCCQATGAEYKGKKVGAIGHIGCFSFSAKKHIFTGEGGMLITSHRLIRQRISYFRHQTRNLYQKIGADVTSAIHVYNMTEMQAGLARRILKKLDELNQIRKQNYSHFEKMVKTYGIPIQLPTVLPEANPAFSRLVFLIDYQKLRTTRTAFLNHMKRRGIPMRTFYPQPLYSYSLFQLKKDGITNSEHPFSSNTKRSYQRLHFPYVERFCAGMVGMNFSPYLTKQHIDHLVYALDHALNKRNRKIS